MRVALGLGCSLGDRRRTLQRALHKLHAHPDIAVVACSRGYRTPPMRGGTARGWFLNAVAIVETSLSPEALLDVCRALEATAGRRRARWWGDRTLDLDVLLADDLVREGPSLILPHPGIADRPFVRAPLHEVWPDASDPRSGVRWADLPAARGPRAVPVCSLWAVPGRLPARAS